MDLVGAQSVWDGWLILSTSSPSHCVAVHRGHVVNKMLKAPVLEAPHLSGQVRLARLRPAQGS